MPTTQEFYDQQTGQLTQLKRMLSRSSFTRPSDTTQYAAGDVVGPVTTPAPLTFSGVGRSNGGSGQVVGANIVTNNGTVTAGTFRLHLFNKTITPQADNAAFTGLYAARADYLGYIDFTILVADGASAADAQTQNRGSIGTATGMPIDFVCAAGDTTLFGVLVVTGTYTPASAQVFQVTLIVSPDPTANRLNQA